MALTEIINRTDYNYIEFVVSSRNSESSLNIYDTDLDKDVFYNILRKLQNESYKYFQKDFKQYTSGNLIYETSKESSDIKVYKKVPINAMNTVNGIQNVTALCYKKTKLSILSFPSSLNINSILNVRRLTFRVNNRIYINFEIKQKLNGDNNYNIFVNYNHDPNVDASVMCRLIQSILLKIA